MKRIPWIYIAVVVVLALPGGCGKELGSRSMASGYGDAGFMSDSETKSGRCSLVCPMECKNISSVTYMCASTSDPTKKIGVAYVHKILCIGSSKYTEQQLVFYANGGKMTCTFPCDDAPLARGKCFDNTGASCTCIGKGR